MISAVFAMQSISVIQIMVQSTRPIFVMSFFVSIGYWVNVLSVWLVLCQFDHYPINCTMLVVGGLVDLFNVNINSVITL